MRAIKVTYRATPVQRHLIAALRKNPDAYIRVVGYYHHYEILGAAKRIMGVPINPTVDGRTMLALQKHGVITPCKRIRNDHTQVGWTLEETPCAPSR